MRYKELLYTTVLAILAAGCASDNGSVQPVEEKPVEIRLGCSLKAQTRGYTPSGTTVNAGGTYYVWADIHPASSASTVHTADTPDYIKAWKLTSAAGGALESSIRQHYPSGSDNLDFLGLRGTLSPTPTEGTTALTDVLSHSVVTAQNTAAGYDASDLLLGTAYNCVRTPFVQNIPFTHVLSKIEVFLFAGNGYDKTALQSASLSVLGTKLQAGLTFSRTATPVLAITASGATGDIAMRQQTADDVVMDGTTAPYADYVSPLGDPSPDKHAYLMGEAVIVPQYVSSDGTASGTAVDFVSVTIGTSTLKAKVKQDFQSGKRYVLYVTITNNEMYVTTSLADWIDGGNSLGDAELAN